MDADIKQRVDELTQREVDREAQRLASGKDNGVLGEAQARTEAEGKREQLRRIAMEEYIADLAEKVTEKGFEALDKKELTFLQRVKEMVMKLFVSIGMPKKLLGTISDKDIIGMIKLSYLNLKNEGRGILGEAEKIDYQQRSHFGEGPMREMDERESRQADRELATALKTKEGVSQRAVSLMKSPHLTSVTDGATLLDGAKLPTFFESVTPHGEESSHYRCRDEEGSFRNEVQNFALNSTNVFCARDLTAPKGRGFT